MPHPKTEARIILHRSTHCHFQFVKKIIIFIYYIMTYFQETQGVSLNENYHEPEDLKVGKTVY